MHKLRVIWRDLNDSLWFVPTLMVAAALGLAYALVHLDLRVGRDWVRDYPLLFGAGADGARGMLTAIAGSMMTVASLIFSLTLSTLAQVSSQYTPRVLRNFMRSRTNQLVLGFFVSVFVYCLLVLRTIRGGEGEFIPSLAITFGLVLALLSIGVLVFFIHHMASGIQAANIIEAVATETEAAIMRLFPQNLGEAADDEATAAFADATLAWIPVPALATGYVQTIDNDGLLALAQRQHGIVRMERGLGSFVARGSALVSVARVGGASLALTEALVQELNEQFSLGSQRTTEQDAGFGLRQLVDIGLKALSPGINDTSTAVICIDYLGALLAQLAARRYPTSLRVDADEQVRVVAISPTFASFATTAFNQILAAGEGDVAVYLRLLTALATTASRTQAPSRRAVLRQQVKHIEAAIPTLTADYDQAQVRQRVQEVLALLG